VAQWLAYASPCPRFAADLAVDCARLPAGAVRTFTVADFHVMLLACLPAHPWISFAGLSLIKALRRPLGPFFFCAPIRP